MKLFACLRTSNSQAGKQANGKSGQRGRAKRKIPFWMNVAIALVAPFICTHSSNGNVLCPSQGESQHPLTVGCLASFALVIWASRLAPGEQTISEKQQNTQRNEEFNSALASELRANSLQQVAHFANGLKHSSIAKPVKGKYNIESESIKLHNWEENINLRDTENGLLLSIRAINNSIKLSVSTHCSSNLPIKLQRAGHDICQVNTIHVSSMWRKDRGGQSWTTA